LWLCRGSAGAAARPPTATSASLAQPASPSSRSLPPCTLPRPSTSPFHFFTSPLFHFFTSHFHFALPPFALPSTLHPVLTLLALTSSPSSFPTPPPPAQLAMLTAAGSHAMQASAGRGRTRHVNRITGHKGSFTTISLQRCPGQGALAPTRVRARHPHLNVRAALARPRRPPPSSRATQRRCRTAPWPPT
jgi:hypothetical protein